jgi:hypothetical protein
MFVTDVASYAALRPRISMQCYGEMQNVLVQARRIRHTGAVVWLITGQGTGGKAMLPDGRYVTDEDAARQIQVTPITFRRWLGVGTMPQVQVEGTSYVRQSDVDAFVEACQCRNQKVYEPKRAKAVAS